MNIKLLPLALAIVFPGHCLMAQESSAVRAEVRLLAFSDAVKVKEVFAQDPAAPPDAPSVAVPVKTYLNHQFNPLELKSRKIVFTTKPDRASLTREGEVAGEVTLPDGGNSSILLFLPGKPGGKSMYQIMAVPDSKRAFPAGSFNITNLSPLPVRLMLEDKNFDFKPGQNHIVENPPVRPDGQSGMRAFAFKDEKWISISTGLWPSPGDARGLMILFLEPVSGNVQLQSFDDVPPRVPKPAVTTATAP
jgi:hypothetical protein